MYRIQLVYILGLLLHKEGILETRRLPDIYIAVVTTIQISISKQKQNCV